MPDAQFKNVAVKPELIGQICNYLPPIVVWFGTEQNISPVDRLNIHTKEKSYLK